MSLFLVKLSSRQHGFQKKDWWGRARTEDSASTLRKSRQRRGGVRSVFMYGQGGDGRTRPTRQNWWACGGGQRGRGYSWAVTL